ncbi:unnamed protein product, partial [Bubo scandiacus]
AWNNQPFLACLFSCLLAFFISLLLSLLQSLILHPAQLHRSFKLTTSFGEIQTALFP